MPDKLKIIIKKGALKHRVKELGEEISRDYRDKDPVLVGILNGSFIFLADLIRELKIPHRVDFVSVTSYGSGKQSAGAVKVLKDLSINIGGKHVIIVEDIIDTGLTLDFIRHQLLTRNPKSLKIAALLNKRSSRKKKVASKYVGFSIPDQFVVGYGLDYADKYRNLPHIARIVDSSHNQIPAGAGRRSANSPEKGLK